MIEVVWRSKQNVNYDCHIHRWREPLFNIYRIGYLYILALISSAIDCEAINTDDYLSSNDSTLALISATLQFNLFTY